MIDAVLGDRDLSLEQLSGLLALRGPGSFTGLRVGLSTAFALHQATGVRVGAVSTTAVLAASASNAAPGRLIAAVDALRGEWFVQTFAAPDARPDGEIERQAATDLALSSDATVVGFGVSELANIAGPETHLLEAQELAPTAALLASTWTEWRAEDLLSPLYMRPPAVTPAKS